jgi:hypothetical protein
LEFKKKDAAYCMYVKRNASFAELLETALHHNRKPKQAVRTFCKTLERHDEPCFGLDSDSHVPNVGFCADHGIRYRYLVWDKSPSLPIDGLLDENLLPTDSVSLWHAVVTPQDFGH